MAKILSLSLLILNGMVLAAVAVAARAPAPLFYPAIAPPPSATHHLLSPYGIIHTHPLSLDNISPTSMENIVPKPPHKSFGEKSWIWIIGIILFLVVISSVVEFLKKFWKQNHTFLVKMYAKLRRRPAKEDVGEEIFFDAPEEFIVEIAPEEEEAAPAPTRDPAEKKFSRLAVFYEVVNGICTVGVAIWALYTYIDSVK